ncbi:MAG TPA: helix-turn-helix domain-containing protein [Candidatus Saccharimonadales bacterium]|nr:helix-turn-helix domain-containing protein [Candidatus Saccharimonadales bacterium]
MNVAAPKLLTQYDSEAIEPRVGCVAAAMDIIGSKWTALILRDLAAGPKRFSELEKSVGSINPRTLSQRLDELQTQGILTKQVFTEVPPRTEYTLTQKGQDLIPVLRQMAAWGTKYATR